MEKGTSGAFLAYAMGDPAGTTATDLTANARTGTYSGTITHPASATCPRDATTAAGFNGTTSCLISATAASQQSAPNVFTVELWFKTTVAGGKLVGFGNTTTTGSTETSFDRHLYLDNTGRLLFGVRPSAVKTVSSSATYLDGAWHHAAATLSSAGMALYVDGVLVASDPATTTAQAFTGNWRFGCGKLTNWTGAPTNFFYTGALAYGAVYTTALSAAQVREHYLAGLA